MIYTTYFANLRKMPEDIIPVAVCRKCPSWWSDLIYETLAPSSSDFYRYKTTGNMSEFVEAYQRNTLYRLDQHAVLEELHTLTGSENIALVCYEKPTEFCHRHVLGLWMEQAGIPCPEYPVK